MMTIPKRFNINPYWTITAGFIAAKLLIHLLTNTRYELLRDEMLYFNMGEHLSWGYATVPPVTGLLAFIMQKAFGFSVFGIRLFPALTGGFSVYLVARLVKEFGGGIAALVIAASSYLFCTGILLSSTLFTPNAFEEMIWLTASYLIFKMAKHENPRLWIPVAVVLPIGFLNKYSVLLFITGFFLALLTDRRRKLLVSKYFLTGILIGLLIISPNLIWQYNHGWPVTLHMNELRSSQLDLLGYSGFFVYLFSFSQGSVIIWLTGLAALLISKKEREYRYLGIASLTIMLLFLLFKGKGYYVLGLLPLLFAFAGYIMEKYLTGSLGWIKWGTFTISVLMSIAALPSGIPLLSFDKYEKYLRATSHFICHPLMEWDNGEKHTFPQAYADMTGWHELAGIVYRAYHSLNEEERKKCTIFCERSYGYAGAVYFYGRKYKLPLPVTFHESYTFWAPDSIPDGPVIYIYRNINNLNELFSDITEAGSVDNKYFRENGLKVFLCKSPKKDIPSIYSNLAREEKMKYSRTGKNQ